MKHYNRVIRPMYPLFRPLFSILFLLFAFSIFSYGQDPVVADLPMPIGPGVDVSTLIEWTDVLFAGLVNLLGYLTHYIPGIKNIKSKVYQVAAMALVLGAVFVQVGGAEAINLVLAYFGATSFYELILKELPKLFGLIFKQNKVRS